MKSRQTERVARVFLFAALIALSFFSLLTSSFAEVPPATFMGALGTSCTAFHCQDFTGHVLLNEAGQISAWRSHYWEVGYYHPLYPSYTMIWSGFMRCGAEDNQASGWRLITVTSNMNSAALEKLNIIYGQCQNIQVWRL